MYNQGNYVQNTNYYNNQQINIYENNKSNFQQSNFDESFE